MTRTDSSSGFRSPSLAAVTPEALARRIRLGDVQWSPDGRRLIWLEGRSAPESSPLYPGIQSILMVSTDGGTGQPLTVPSHSLRGHWGYGGGEFSAGDEFVLYTERDGRLYLQEYPGLPPRPLTPEGTKAAAPVLSPDGQLAVFIAIDGPDECLAVIPTSGGTVEILASGADFYAQPAWSPDGHRMAWIEWDHPGLPWESARLMLAHFDPGTLLLADVRQAAGGEGTPVFQPAFSPDGRWLSYIYEDGEWERLLLLDLEIGQVHPIAGPAVLSQPLWEQGLRVVAWQSDSRALLHLRLEDGQASLWRQSLDGSPPQKIPLGDYTWLDHFSLSVDGRIAGVFSAAHLPPVVAAGVPPSLHIYSQGQPDLPLEGLSPAVPLAWQNREGHTIHGIFTPPAGGLASALPPAVIYIHGGPNMQRYARFESERSFFTSRGFAWLDVNYRGSTGFGCSYRRSLYGSWGIYDVEDTASAAAALIEQGLARPGSLALYGSSAGGFTLLNTMIRSPGVFAVGVALYPVTDLVNFPDLDFKLEKHYHESLLGSLPAAAQIYRQRSPLYHAAGLKDPLLLFHGLDDPVVPVGQSREIAAALQARGVPCSLRLFEGEGHGFRRPETVAAVYQGVLEFLDRYLHPNQAG